MTTDPLKAGSLTARFSLPPIVCRIAACLLFVVFLLPLPAKSTDMLVLDFELNDLTFVTDNSEEVARTAMLGDMLRQTLQEKHGFRVVAVSPEQHANANQGFGYLLSHPEAAAELGREHDARWVVITQLHKPSFLFAYLIAQVVHVPTDSAYPEVIVEIKGQQDVINQRGINKLSGKIARQIAAISRP